MALVCAADRGEEIIYQIMQDHPQQTSSVDYPPVKNSFHSFILCVLYMCGRWVVIFYQFSALISLVLNSTLLLTMLTVLEYAAVCMTVMHIFISQSKFLLLTPLKASCSLRA